MDLLLSYLKRVAFNCENSLFLMHVLFYLCLVKHDFE